MAREVTGYIFAALAAASYGTNPIFAKPLYAEGMNPDSVLLFRYLLGLLLLMGMMAWNGYRRKDLKSQFVVNRHSLPQLVLMGILMAMSSLTLFMSYNYMPVGIASTLLFIYPILVAVIMTLIYHERMSWLVVVCLILASSGIALLCKSDEAAPEVVTSALPVSPFMVGLLLVMLSSLSYAIYLVGLSKSRLRTVASMPVTLYVIFFGTFLFVGRLAMGTEFTMPTTTMMWANLFCLGFFPTVVSLICTAKAIQAIGSTQTAIFGALEPVTAVVLGIIILGETLVLREVVGMLMILVSVTLVMLRQRK